MKVRTFDSKTEADQAAAYYRGFGYKVVMLKMNNFHYELRVL